jgi:hypothetical protein
MAKIKLSQKEFNKITKNINNETNNENKKGGIMKNKLSDLNNYLFAQIERLNEEDLTEEGIKKEIGRANAITKVANAITSNMNAALSAAKFFENAEIYSETSKDDALKMLGVPDGK